MIAKLFKITRSAWIAFFIAFIAAFIMAGAAGAQEENADPEIRAKIYGVTFPITELGGCQNYYDCRTYCEDPVNSTDCLDFGKKKGFYKDEDQLPKKEAIMEKAKRVLGCDSYGTCQSFCQIPANYEKCDSFAKKEGLSGGHVEDPKNKVILEKAKEILGCDSYSTCASYCSDDSNREKCTVFAKETGLRGGEQRVGPGGCTSENTCRTFCSDPNNFQVCRGFAQSAKQEFKGPGGCNSEDSCRSYCERNPRECGSPPGGEGGPVAVPMRYDPQEMCNRTPACSWKDNTCVCGGYNFSENKQKRDEYAKVCRENPARCTPGGIGGSESREDRAAFEKYCSENPEKCRPAYSDMMGGRNYDPAIECTKYAGCAWINGNCQCGTKFEVPGSGISQSSYEKGCTPGHYWDGSKCVAGSNEGPGWSDSAARERNWCQPPSGGCGADSFWDYTYCSCSKRSGESRTGTTDPGDGCRRAGGNWNGNYCQMPPGNPARTPGGTSGGSRGGSENYTSGGQPGGPGASYPGKSSAGSGAYGGGYDASGNYVGGSYGGYDSAGNYVGTGGGSLTGGYSGGSSEGSYSGGGSYSGSSSYTPPTSTSGSSGGSAPAPAPVQQSQPAPAPAQESQPAPQPAQQSQPAPAPAQESQSAPAPPAPAPASEPAPAPAVQGINAVRNLFDRILDFLR